MQIGKNREALVRRIMRCGKHPQIMLEFSSRRDSWCQHEVYRCSLCVKLAKLTVAQAKEAAR